MGVNAETNASYNGYALGELWFGTAFPVWITATKYTNAPGIWPVKLGTNSIRVLDTNVLSSAGSSINGVGITNGMLSGDGSKLVNVDQFASMSQMSSASVANANQPLTNYSTGFGTGVFGINKAGGYITNLQSGVFEISWGVGSAASAIGEVVFQVRTNNVNTTYKMAGFLTTARGLSANHILTLSPNTAISIVPETGAFSAQQFYLTVKRLQ